MPAMKIGIGQIKDLGLYGRFDLRVRWEICMV
jgi:hypothetical protein